MNISVSLVDSHAHLDMQEFNPDRQQVIERARRSGIHRILCPLDLSSEESLRIGFELSQKNPDILLAAGIHPHQASQLKTCHLDNLKKLAKENKILAVGEIGLDFHYNFSSRDKQLEAFKLQLELAAELGLPAIIHSREAEKELLELIPDPGFSPGGILHCFTESYETARKMIDRGFLISFSGILTYPGAEQIRETARKLPLDRLLVETDSPYLTPLPEKKKYRRNEPAFILSTARLLAELHKITLEELAEITGANFSLLLKLKKQTPDVKM